MTQAQLETLQTENQHLQVLLQRLEPQSPKVRVLCCGSCHYAALQTAADRILFFIWLHRLFLNLTHLSLLSAP